MKIWIQKKLLFSNNEVLWSSLLPQRLVQKTLINTQHNEVTQFLTDNGYGLLRYAKVFRCVKH